MGILLGVGVIFGMMVSFILVQLGSKIFLLLSRWLGRSSIDTYAACVTLLSIVLIAVAIAFRTWKDEGTDPGGPIAMWSMNLFIVAAMPGVAGLIGILSVALPALEMDDQPSLFGNDGRGDEKEDDRDMWGRPK